ncbi:Dehydrin family protein [Raphanus sativus]|uniref:Late embryogenesis abundant protein-like n=1 Tax=Raphanus sativus TaxID=3726 RepID=A0A9W3D8H8_RAPSA|nr:late embryogenesis abundant protein-like [Raphanus sativus]KAJ4914021.1 Dehydrin family protein [Raphanus sativus]
MADLKDERGNRIYLTDQQGKPAQLVDELGNAMYVTGVATTVPHLKESSYSGPHPITAPITTTDTPHHAQPISVSHNPVEEHGISSSNSRDEGSGGEGNRRDETKTRVGRHETSTATVESVSAHEGAQEKKSLVKKIKEKLSGHQII